MKSRSLSALCFSPFATRRVLGTRRRIHDLLFFSVSLKDNHIFDMPHSQFNGYWNVDTKEEASQLKTLEFSVGMSGSEKICVEFG